MGEESAVAKALFYVANDLAERRITVRSLNRQADRVRYAESLPPDVVVAQSTTTAGRQADKISEAAVVNCYYKTAGSRPVDSRYYCFEYNGRPTARH